MRNALIGLAMLAAIAGPANSGFAQTTSAAPESPGTGPFPAIFEADATLPAHVVYRPRDLSAAPAKLPVYVWGNGGCSADGTSSRNHLIEIASHGYLVIAAGTIPPGGPRPAPTPPPAAPAGSGALPPPPMPAGSLSAPTPTAALREAIDWAIRENGRADSPYRGRIATDRIAVSGWSCGGLQALNVAPDPRVKTAVIMNSGFFNDASPITGIDNDKAMLARLHTPILYVLGGPTDIAYANGTDDFRRIERVPAAMINIPVGHAGTYFQPNGGLAAQLVLSWLDWQLKGDAAAGKRFTGAHCGYCADPRFTLERKRLD